MNTFLKSERTKENQKVATFSGEGAYHGSSKPKEYIIPVIEEPEVLPIYLMEYVKRNSSDFGKFKAEFTNDWLVEKRLDYPTDNQIINDGVTFVWCPIKEAIQEAGPLTKQILQEMENLLSGRKKYTYIDSKIQFFQKGDLPVDSKLWHIDGSIAIRDSRAQQLGYSLLHDMKSRLMGPAKPPLYMAYQSSEHCATQFVRNPISIELPDCIPSFDLLDKLVKECDPEYWPQSAASIVRFDGLSLHRAFPATANGWRLWVRCIETDREVKLEHSIIECYGSVFRPDGVL